MTSITSLRHTAVSQISALASSADRGFGGPDMLHCLEMCDLAAARRVAAATDAELAPIVSEINAIEERLSGAYSESDDSSLADLFFAARSLPH